MAAICLCLASSGAHAGAAADPVETLVVTGSYAPSRAGELPTRVEVITRDDIERVQVASAQELLRRLAGLYVQQPGVGSRSEIFTRGADPNHTVILIDGVRLNDPTNDRGGSFDLQSLAIDDIERIEVVRGPISAVHGSEALAGAIHVFTRSGRAAEDAGSVYAQGGRFGFGQGGVSLRGTRGPLDIALSGSLRDEGQPESEGELRDGNVSGRIGVQLRDDLRAQATLRYSDSRAQAFPDQSGGVRLALLRERERRDRSDLSTRIGLAATPSERSEVVADLRFYRGEERRESPGIASPSPPPAFAIPPETARDQVERIGGSLRGTREVLDGVALTAGADVYRERGRSTSNLGGFDLDRVVGGPFAELVWRSDFGLSVQAGTRADFPDDSSSEWTPRVALTYGPPGLPVLLRASWAEGFKLPSFYALGNPVVGDPSLRSERSRGWDVGAELSLCEDRLRAGFTWFEIDIDDLIDFDLGTFSLVNRSRTRSRGFELEAEAEPSQELLLAAQVTFDNTDVIGSPVDLANRPRWRGDLQASWSPASGALSALSVHLNALFVGSRLADSVPTGRRRLSSWERVDLALGWDFEAPLEGLRLVLAIENLLDASYEEAIGFPATGIRPRAGLDYRF